MKKALAWLLTLVMVLGMFGCSATTPAATEAPAAATAEETTATEAPAATDAPESVDNSKLRIVALLPGSITDNGWNYICYDAVQKIGEKYGCTAEYIENIAVSDMGEYLNMYGEDGYDMVIVHGAQFEAVTTEIAPEYPNTKFCLSYGFKIDGSTDANLKDIPNLAYVGPVGMGVVIGGIMGILTDTDKVVFLGGLETPAIADIVSGIAAGVALTNPDATATTTYIGTLTDQDMAREAANAFINQGYDVVCASANSAQLGCLWAAETAGVYALGFNSDQYEIAPNAVVLSVMRNYSYIYMNVFESMIAGNWKSGKVAYDLDQQGTLVSDWHGWDTKLPAEKVTAINEFISKIFSGGYAGQY
ncbi:MAG: BMP family protein [Christensenella sp.]|nr:BMP family protein [Christensenella sp.]